MPVPGSAIDQNLAVFDASEYNEAHNGSDKAQNAGDEMNGMGAGKNVKRMAAIAACLEGKSLEH